MLEIAKIEQKCKNPAFRLAVASWADTKATDSQIHGFQSAF
jgi:hypothetical protein